MDAVGRGVSCGGCLGFHRRFFSPGFVSSPLFGYAAFLAMLQRRELSPAFFFFFVVVS